MKAVEPAHIGDELGPLGLEHLPDGLVGDLGMGIFLGVGDAPIRQPGVHLVKTLEPQARREKALAHQADLIFDLALLPAGGRRAGDGFNKIMRAHLQEAAVVLPSYSGPIDMRPNSAIARSASTNSSHDVPITGAALSARVNALMVHSSISERPVAFSSSFKLPTTPDISYVAPIGIEVVGKFQFPGLGLNCNCTAIAFPRRG